MIQMLLKRGFVAAVLLVPASASAEVRRFEIPWGTARSEVLAHSDVRAFPGTEGGMSGNPAVRAPGAKGTSEWNGHEFSAIYFFGGVDYSDGGLSYIWLRDIDGDCADLFADLKQAYQGVYRDPLLARLDGWEWWDMARSAKVQYKEPGAYPCSIHITPLEDR